MKHIVRYLLEGNGSIPLFIEDGGHFALGEEVVGVSVDSAKRHVPASVHILSRSQLLERIQATCNNPEQAETILQHFLSEHGLDNYE